MNTLKVSYYGVFAGICYLNMIEDPRIGHWFGFMKQKKGKFMFNIFIAMLIFPMDPPSVCVDDTCLSGANGWLGWIGSLTLVGISSIHLYAYCKDGETEEDKTTTEPMMDESSSNNPNYVDPFKFQEQNKKIEELTEPSLSYQMEEPVPASAAVDQNDQQNYDYEYDDNNNG